MKERIPYFDNLKFLLGSLVVLGHAMGPFAKAFPEFAWAYYFIYTFHMPLFVFVFGLFAKSAMSRERGYNIARPFAFLLLYFALNFAIFAVQKWAAGRDVVFDPLNVSNASWFLLAVAAWLALLPIVSRVRLSALLPISVALALAAGYFDDIRIFLSASRIICFLPFFILGVKTPVERVLELRGAGLARRLRAPAAAFVACMLLLVLLAGMYTDILYFTRGMLIARVPYSILDSAAPYGALFRAAWYALASAMSLSVMLITPLGSAFFSRLGANTLGLYIWHPIIIRLLSAYGFTVWVRELAEVSAFAKLIPIGLAVVVSLVFSLRPPFGSLASRLLNVKVFVKVRGVHGKE